MGMKRAWIVEEQTVQTVPVVRMVSKMATKRVWIVVDPIVPLARVRGFPYRSILNWIITQRKLVGKLKMAQL